MEWYLNRSFYYSPVHGRQETGSMFGTVLAGVMENAMAEVVESIDGRTAVSILYIYICSVESHEY